MPREVPMELPKKAFFEGMVERRKAEMAV